MGIAFLIRHPSTSRPSGGGNVAPPPATLRCCTNRKPKPRSISPLPDTQREMETYLRRMRQTNTRQSIFNGSTHRPPPPPTPLSGTRESIQFPQHPLAAINGHRFLPKITISLQNIFHVFQAEVAFIDRHPQPSGGSFSDGKKQTAKNVRDKRASPPTTHQKRTQYILLRLSLWPTRLFGFDR